MTSVQVQYFTWSIQEQNSIEKCLTNLGKNYNTTILDMDRNFYEIKSQELNLTEIKTCVKSYYIHTVDGVQVMKVITDLDKVMIPVSVILFGLFVMLAIYTNLAYDPIKIKERQREKEQNSSFCSNKSHDEKYKLEKIVGVRSMIRRLSNALNRVGDSRRADSSHEVTHNENAMSQAKNSNVSMQLY